MLRKPLKRLLVKCQHYGCTTLSAWAGHLSGPSIRRPSRVFSVVRSVGSVPIGAVTY